MSEPEAASAITDLAALKALQADASELERINGLLDRFNVFEAIGFVRQEVKHSRFLAFLLDPKQTHDLGDLFLRCFLRKASESTDRASLPQINHDGSLDQTTVHTEIFTDDGRIDVLLLNEVGEWAIIVENKVWTTEHHDQLGRYHRSVKANHPGWRVAGLYLTPFGDTPSHEAYGPFGYAAVCDLLDGILGGQDKVPRLDVRMTIQHYTDMVRRHIVGDPEIARLCQQMYRKHKRAFDLVYEHRPDAQSRIRSVVEGLIREHPRLELDKNRRDNHKFGVTDWDTPALLTSTGWTKSKRMLLFVFHNNPGSLDLQFFIGPGPEATRQRLLEMARTNPETFVMPPSRHGKFLRIYSRDLLKSEAYEDLDEEEREQEIRRHWDEFLDNDLPRIEEALRREAWIWETVETNEH